MGVLLLLMGFALIVVGLVCSVIVLIDAFQNEIWKGIVYPLCGLYALYYLFVEFDHEKKWQIIAGIFVGSFGGWFLLMAGGFAFGS